MEQLPQWEFDTYILSLPRGHGFGEQPPVGAWAALDRRAFGAVIFDHTDGTFGMFAMRRRVDRVPDSSELDLLRSRYSKETAFLDEPWRFSFWQVANQAELFAYKARGSDGVCLIERIDLPDGRVVVVCIQIPGNPGTSITNAVEDICLQVCERFEIPPARLIWLEHYDRFGADEWNMVAFERIPPQGLFESPRWTKMTPRLWEGLLLRPKKALRVYAGQYESKVKKLFAWPAESD
jgi:hypothetical protein